MSRGGHQRLAEAIPVTLTVEPPGAPGALGESASLSFSAVEGGCIPAAQSLSVTNTGGGTLSFTTSDNASWLAATPASGTAPATCGRRHHARADARDL